MRDSMTIGIIFSALSFIVANTYSALTITVDHLTGSDKQIVVEEPKSKKHFQCKEVTYDYRR